MLACCGRVEPVNPNAESGNRRVNPAAVTRPTTVDKIRDVEAVDPGLLSPVPNSTVNTRTTNANALGKQFSTPPGSFGNSFGTNAFGNSIPPETGFPFAAGVGQSGAFIPPNGQVGGFQSGGAFPTNGVFPGGGILPGPGSLPPGSVSPDTVVFSAARASDYTRVGVTQVRFDFTLTDVGYGW